MIVTAKLFPKLQNVKNLLRPLSRKRRLGKRFESQYVNAFQILAKTPSERFYHVFSSFSGKLIPKMSPPVLGEILGVFINTLTADVKDPVQDCENLLLPIQMHLSQKPKAFSLLFVPFLVSTSNFKHFEEKDDCHS